jgi:hypothetical protein
MFCLGRIGALLALSVVFSGEAVAQLPKAPTTPTLAIITLKSVKLDGTPVARLRYERAGTSPAEYRASTSANFSGASWVAFTESGTTSTTTGSTTVVTGFIPAANPYFIGAGCPQSSVKHRVFLQMRRFTQGRMVNSNIVADSICVPFG